MTRKGGSDLKPPIRDARFGSRREWRRQYCSTIASPRGPRGLRHVERRVLTRRGVQADRMTAHPISFGAGHLFWWGTKKKFDLLPG